MPHDHSDFARRLATMLECALLDRPGSWDEACALLDEYRAASRAVMAPVPEEGNGCTCSVLEAVHGQNVDGVDAERSPVELSWDLPARAGAPLAQTMDRRRMSFGACRTTFTSAISQHAADLQPCVTR